MTVRDNRGEIVTLPDGRTILDRSKAPSGKQKLPIALQGNPGNTVNIIPGAGFYSDPQEVARAELEGGDPFGEGLVCSVSLPSILTSITAQVPNVGYPANLAMVTATVQYGSKAGGLSQLVFDVGHGASIYIPATWARMTVQALGLAGAGAADAVEVAGQIIRTRRSYKSAPILTQRGGVTAASPTVTLQVPAAARAVTAFAFDTNGLPDSLRLTGEALAVPTRSWVQDINIGDPPVSINVLSTREIILTRTSATVATWFALQYDIEA